MAAKTLLTWEEFEALPDDGLHHELVEGELIALPPPKLTHSKIAHRVYGQILAARRAGSVYMEAGFQLSRTPASWVQPDVSFALPGRRTEGDYMQGAPDLAVEIVSPSESALDLERKVDLCLGHGSAAVWVIYPEARKVRIFDRDGHSHGRTIGEMISCPELFPGWEAPVASFFED